MVEGERSGSILLLPESPLLPLRGEKTLHPCRDKLTDCAGWFKVGGEHGSPVISCPMPALLLLTCHHQLGHQMPVLNRNKMHLEVNPSRSGNRVQFLRHGKNVVGRPSSQGWAPLRQGCVFRCFLSISCFTGLELAQVPLSCAP